MEIKQIIFFAGLKKDTMEMMQRLMAQARPLLMPTTPFPVGGEGMLTLTILRDGPSILH